MLATGALVATLLPVVASAQTPAPTRRWAVELYGGALTQSQSSTGTPIAEFPVGETFMTESGSPSRLVPSWWFGDGARLFNEVAARFSQINGRTFATITPLDDVLRKSGDRTGGTGLFGVRISRAISSTMSVDVLLERNTGGLTPPDETVAAVTAAAAAFETAFLDLLGTAPVTLLQSNTVLTFPDASASQLRVLAAVTRRLASRDRWSISATAGLGVQQSSGNSGEVRLSGRYQFSLFGSAPMFERDDLLISFSEPKSAVIGLVGLGAGYDLTETLGLRAGLRLDLTQNRANTTVRTSPFNAVGQAPGTLPSLTTPAIQFSSVPGIRSSLHPDSGSTLTTFTGSGVNRQISITLGLFRRF